MPSIFASPPIPFREPNLTGVDFKLMVSCTRLNRLLARPKITSYPNLHTIKSKSVNFDFFFEYNPISKESDSNWHITGEEGTHGNTLTCAQVHQ